MPLATDLLSLPFSQNLKILKGFFQVPEKIRVHFQEPTYQCLVAVSPIPLLESDKDSANVFFSQQKLGHPEAFRILCTENKITVDSSTPQGGLFALHAISQILKHGKTEIPCFEVNDRPILKRRGFMLDVSRCKVPTMETIFNLIDLLSILRINEFQLYIEHTYAFENHRTVWNESSPFTGSEIQKIDQYCRDRFIQLVPNLNSFGHFERWLRHEPYKKLAECPKGFHRDEPYMIRDHGSVLKPNQESLKFIDSLYGEYLPNFSSEKFNVGLDEPWELGQGWSKPEVEKRGKHSVYLDHLKGILSLVENRGKSMEFWADVLLEKPDKAKDLPKSASPVIWGYEANHPFDEQAQTIAACGLKYSLAPGTATWRSFSGRWKTARANLISAIQNSQKHEADGILLTSWGDCGNHQPWATLYPPLVLGAQLAWSGQDATDTEIGDFIDHTIFDAPCSGLGKSFIDLAKLDQHTGFNLPNNSLPWFALFSAQPEKLPDHLSELVTVKDLKRGLDWMKEIENINFAFENNLNADFAKQEWRLGIELSKLGLKHALSLMGERQIIGQPESHASLIEKFQDIWLLRAREGGLQEASNLLKQALDQTLLS